MAAHVASLRLYLAIWLALMVMLVATVALARYDLAEHAGRAFAWLNLGAALTIAVVKALLVVLYFMHVRWSSRLTWVFVVAGFVWLGILMALIFSDYFSRGWYDNDSIYAPRATPTMSPLEHPDRARGLWPQLTPATPPPHQAEAGRPAGHAH